MAVKAFAPLHVLVCGLLLAAFSASGDDAYHYGPVPLDMATRTYDYGAAGQVTLDAAGHFRNRLGPFTALGIDYHQPWFQPLTHQSGRFMNGDVSPSLFDLDRVDGDLRLLKNAGFNVIVLRAQWGSLDETHPALFNENVGKWQRVFDLVEKHGLYAEVWCAFNSTPQDVIDDGSLGRAHNQRLTNPQIQNRIIDSYVVPLARELKDRPSLITWRWEFEGLGPELLYEDPHGLKLFRRFAKRKYGAVERLNGAWGPPHNYASFDEVPDFFQWAKRNGLLTDTDWRGPAAEHGKITEIPMLRDLNEWRMDFRIRFLAKLASRLRPILGDRAMSATGLGFGWSGWYPGHMMFDAGRCRRLSGLDVVGGIGAYPHGGEWLPELAKYKEGCNGPFLGRHYGPIIAYATARCFLTWGPAKASEIGMISMPLGEEAQSDWIMTQMVDAIGSGLTSCDVYESVSLTCSSPEDSEPHPHKVLKDLRNLSRSLRGVVFDSQTPQSRILVIWNRGYNNIDAVWRQTFVQWHLAHYVYQLHVPWDVAADDRIALVDSPDKVNLNKYDLVIVPSQHFFLRDEEFVYADGSVTQPDAWALLAEWIRAEKGRTLFTGYFGERNYLGRDAEMPPEMAELTGLSGPFERTSSAWPTTRNVITDADLEKCTRRLFITEPFGSLHKGDTITYREYAGRVVNLRKPPDGEVLAALDSPDGPPVLVRNDLPNGNHVYTAGFELGPGMDGPWAMPPKLDAMTPIYEALAAEVGISSPLGRDIPRNLGLYISRDKSVILFKERFDRDTEGVLVRMPLADIPQDAPEYTNVAATVEAGELVLSGRVPARGVLVARRPSISVDGVVARKHGLKAQVMFSVFNDANTSTSPIEVQVHCGRPGADGSTLLAEAVAEDVPELASVRLMVEIDLPEGSRAEQIHVVVDPDHKLPDCNRTDNVAAACVIDE